MQRNFKNALKPVVKRGLVNRVGNYFRGFTRRNARVAPLNMNGVPKLQQTIYGVEPGSIIAPNLGTLENKSRIFDENFEQTFIKESISTLLASLDYNKGKNEKLEFLNEYTMRLTNPACTEVEAIYLYDRLISLFILSTISAIFTRISEFDSFALKRVLFEYRREIDKGLQFLVPLIISVKIYENAVLLTAAAVLMLSSFSVFAVDLGMSLFAVVSTLILVAGGQVHYMTKAKSKFENHFFVLPQTCLKIMFSTENTIPIQGLKNRLKFWGLPQIAVDYIFSIGTNGGSVEDIPGEIAQLQNSTQDDCPICAAAYTEEPEKVTTKLECGHKTHTECLAGWFRRQDELGQEHTCPTCRRAASSPLTLVPTNNKRPSDMNQGEYFNFFTNLSQYMFLAKYHRANKSNIAFSQDIIDYHYTMYDSPGTSRANVRRSGRSRNAYETSMALNANNDFGLPALPGTPYDGGSRRRRRGQKKRKTRK